MSIAACIDKLVKLGKISRETGERAKIMEGVATERLSGHMGSTDAAAMAALEAAKIMGEFAQARRFQVAKQAIAQAGALDRVMTHKHSKAAGAMALMSSDIRGAAKGPNVHSHTQVVEGELVKPMVNALEKFVLGMGDRLKGLADEMTGGRIGLVDNTAERNVIRELRGVNTGDADARELATAFKQSGELSVKRAKASGYIFNEKDDWVTPQFWSGERARKHGEEAFMQDVLREYDSGALKIVNDDGIEFKSRADLEVSLRKSWKDIAVGSDEAGHGPFQAHRRRFNFTMDEAGAESWIRLQEKYGGGRDIVSMLTGHIHKQARSIALAEILGPQHGQTVRAIADAVKLDEAKGIKSGILVRGFESAGAFERSYRVATGAADGVASDLSAGIFGGLRSLSVSANLGSGVVSAVTSDPVMLMMTANFNGMSIGKLATRVIEDIATSGKDRAALAAQLNLVAHGVSDIGVGGARFAGEVPDAGTLGRMADIVIRSQGLQAWTESLKRAFTMEFMGLVARQADLPFDKVDQSFRNFLDRYGFTADEWNKIRVAEKIDVDGAKFFDHTAVEDRALGDRLLGAILDERGYAVLEPDIRTRQVATAGAQRGTFAGEMGRNLSLFKSFPMAMSLMHGVRSYQLLKEGGVGQAAAYAMPMMLALTVGGAMALQAKSLLTGKDPQDMASWGFLARAFMQGGGAGIYGDLLNNAATRSNQGIVTTFLGPVASILDTAGKLTFGNVQQGVEGKKTSFGKELVDAMRRYTPGSSLWFARLAVDRLFFDTIQTQIDPEYMQSWNRERMRMQRDQGQDFWWRRGDWVPDRPPELERAWQ